MEEQTEIMWNFLETAFRTGALDEMLELVNRVTGKDFENMSQAFADLEDVFMEMEDTSAMERKFAVLFQVLKELTREDVLEGMGVLLGMANPLISAWMETRGGDSPLSAANQAEAREKAVKSLKALTALGSIGLNLLMGSPAEKSPRQLGLDAGRMLNKAAAFGNGIMDHDTGTVSDFMAGLFSDMDRQGIGRLANALTDGFLDQRPPIFKWAAATTVKRTKKRLLKK